MQITISSIRCSLPGRSQRIIQTNAGELRPVPNYIIWLMVYLCASVLLQGIGDVALKILSHTSVVPLLPWRTDFLFLTAISVLMGYRTLNGMLERKFDVTKNSIELGILVEIGLIIGDSVFVRHHITDIPDVVPMRLPFIVLTIINVGILLYTYHELQCHHWLKKKKWFH